LARRDGVEQRDARRALRGLHRSHAPWPYPRLPLGWPMVLPWLWRPDEDRQRARSMRDLRGVPRRVHPRPGLAASASGRSMSVEGLVEEKEDCLAVYGEDLDPAVVTSLLGCSHTTDHLRGDRRGPRSPPQKRGAWFLDVQRKAPEGPEELSLALLDQLPTNESVWITLGAARAPAS